MCFSLEFSPVFSFFWFLVWFLSSLLVPDFMKSLLIKMSISGWPGLKNHSVVFNVPPCR